MKILILIPMWKRPEIVQVSLLNLRRFRRESPHEISVLAVICPHDPFRKEIETLCDYFDVERCYYFNLPLGRKMNAGINYALRKDFDYLMNFGSDDLIHPSIFDLYQPYFDKKTPVFGVNTLYFYEYETGRTLFFRCYTDGLVVGAGRMIAREVLEKMAEKDVYLYDDHVNRSLDSNSHQNMIHWLGIHDEIIDSGEFPYIVDVKTHTNINHITQIEFHTANVTEVDMSIIEKNFEI